MNTNPWCCDHAVHLCIVVRDMEKTLDNYCALFHLERPPVKWTGEGCARGIPGRAITGNGQAGFPAIRYAPAGADRAG